MRKDFRKTAGAMMVMLFLGQGAALAMPKELPPDWNIFDWITHLIQHFLAM